MKAKLAKEVELLSDISKSFAESLDLEETLMLILKSLDTHLKLRRGMITLLDPDTETINIRIAHGLSKKSRSQASYKIGEGITGLVVQSGKEIVVPDISKDPRFLHKTRSRKQEKGKQIAFFCVPIKLESKTIGTLSVDKQANKSDDFKANVRLLDVIATMAGRTIPNKRINACLLPCCHCLDNRFLFHVFRPNPIDCAVDTIHDQMQVYVGVGDLDFLNNLDAYGRPYSPHLTNQTEPHFVSPTYCAAVVGPFFS